jgi:hypothetical protein
MISVQFAYVREGPSVDLAEFYYRIRYEGDVYYQISELERAGFRIESKSDGQQIPGKFYYAVFDTEEEAALFKLTYL